MRLPFDVVVAISGGGRGNVEGEYRNRGNADWDEIGFNDISPVDSQQAVQTS